MKFKDEIPFATTTPLMRMMKRRWNEVHLVGKNAMIIARLNHLRKYRWCDWSRCVSNLNADYLKFVTTLSLLNNWPVSYLGKDIWSIHSVLLNLRWKTLTSLGTFKIYPWWADPNVTDLNALNLNILFNGPSPANVSFIFIFSNKHYNFYNK